MCLEVIVTCTNSELRLQLWTVSVFNNVGIDLASVDNFIFTAGFIS